MRSNESKTARLLALALAALLAACASKDKPAPPPPVRETVQAPGKQVVTVTGSELGVNVVLDREQVLQVTLPLDTRAVTTGLEWTLPDPVTGVIEVVGSRFERATRDENPSEAAGASVWRLRPVAAGQAGLTFVLRKPRSLDAPVQSATVDVTVK